MYCFTSITNNYLPKARILGASLKKFHPDWKFVVVISEPVHELMNNANEPFDQVLFLKDLNISQLHSWIFKHNIMEICTAVKGPAAFYIAETTKTDKLIYLDPDIAIFNSLGEISDLLDFHPVILTPHQTKPEKNLEDVLNNEVCFLKHGIYNLGFFAVKCEGQGWDFLNWYRDRLMEFCYIDFNWGLYTDQRWCDLAPVLFDQLYIHRDPGCNVARWNLSQRNLNKDIKGNYSVDGSPLKFFHFSGYDSGQGVFEISRYIDGDHCFHELWEWYEKQLKIHDPLNISQKEWTYGRFCTGTKISKEMRLLYRDRIDLQNFFPDPYANDGTLHSYEQWYALNMNPNQKKPDLRERIHHFIDAFLDGLNRFRSYFKPHRDFNE